MMGIERKYTKLHNANITCSYNGNITEHIMGIVQYVQWEYITTHGWNRMVMQQNT